MQLGERVAADLLAARAGDVPATAPYRPLAMPGVYVPTALPIGIEFSLARPWLMQRPDQFDRRHRRRWRPPSGRATLTR